MKVLGVMSGTSCDGVDGVMLELQSVDQPHTPEVLGHSYLPFPKPLRDELLKPERLTLKRLTELHFELPAYYGQALTQIPGWQQASCCGMHGQTVWHQPDPVPTCGTLQLGSSGVLAQHLGMPVVADVRSADMALGGQGAPVVVPFAHWFFLVHTHAPVLVVNLGGICNLTWVTPQREHVVAYDVGPGMMLSDAFAHAVTHGAQGCDAHGMLSKTGQVVEPLLQALVSHPFVRQPPPKSTGREVWGQAYVDLVLRPYGDMLSKRRADIAYTLLVATLEILRITLQADDRLHAIPERMILTGGGAHNPTLVQAARRLFPKTTLEVLSEGVMAPSCHEPAAMALIAARTLAHRVSSLPAVTGAHKAAILGHVHHPSGLLEKGSR